MPVSLVKLGEGIAKIAKVDSADVNYGISFDISRKARIGISGSSATSEGRVYAFSPPDCYYDGTDFIGGKVCEYVKESLKKVGYIIQYENVYFIYDSYAFQYYRINSISARRYGDWLIYTAFAENEAGLTVIYYIPSGIVLFASKNFRAIYVSVSEGKDYVRFVMIGLSTYSGKEKCAKMILPAFAYIVFSKIKRIVEYALVASIGTGRRVYKSRKRNTKHD